MSNDLPTMLRVRCTAGRSDERELVCRAADLIEQQARHIQQLQAKMTCMCGSEINHSAWEGHSPVSMFDYAVEQEVERRLATHTSGTRGT